MKPLPRRFYSRDTVAAAKELLGKKLVRRTDHGHIVAKIVEVEAYKGAMIQLVTPTGERRQG